MNNIQLVNDPFAQNANTNTKVMSDKELDEFCSNIAVQVAEAAHKTAYAVMMYGPNNRSRAYIGQEILRMLSGDAQAAGSVRGTISKLPESLRRNMSNYFGRVIPDHRRECGAIANRLPEPLTGRPVRPAGVEEQEPEVNEGPLNTEEPVLTEGN